MSKNILLTLLTLMILSGESWSIIFPSDPYINQKNYRWRNDDGNESGATWKGPVNAFYTYNTSDLGTNIRLRLEIDNTGDASGTISNSLQYSLDGVVWFNITTSSGTNHWMLSTSPNITHDAATTDQLATGVGGTFTPGKTISNTTLGTISLPNGYNTENEYSIIPTNNILSHTTYYFRNNGFSVYDQLAQINTNCLARVTTVNHGEVCEEGQTVMLSAISLGDNTLTWYDDEDNVVGTGITFTTPPIYESTTYYVEATGPTGCVSGKVPVVANMSGFTYTVHNDYFACGNGSVELSMDYEPGHAVVTWYSDIDMTTSLGTGSIFNTPDISASTTFYAVISTPTCSTSPIPVTAVVRPLPAFEITPSIDTICTGETAIFQATNNPNFTYAWDSGETTRDIETGVYGDHTLIVTDINTTCSDTRTAFLDTMIQVGVEGFDFIPLYHMDYKTVTFYPINDVGTSDYLWYFGDGNTSSDRTPTHTYLDSGRYNVRLIVSNKCDSDTSELELFVRPQNTSIDDLDWSQLMQVYPNPSTGFVTIQSDINKPFNQITLINSLGQLVLNLHLENTTSHEIELTQLPKGQYFILIQNEAGVKALKPIIHQ